MDYPATAIQQAKNAGLGTAARQGAEEFSRFIRGQHPELLKRLPGGHFPSTAHDAAMARRHPASPIDTAATAAAYRRGIEQNRRP